MYSNNARIFPAQGPILVGRIAALKANGLAGAFGVLVVIGFVLLVGRGHALGDCKPQQGVGELGEPNQSKLHPNC